MPENLLQKYNRLINILFLYMNPKSRTQIIDNFHNLYYESSLLGKSWRNNKFLGYPIQKCPLDLFQYQEIIYRLKPDLIIETGTAYGGSALYMATICDAINHGEIITIDIQKVDEPPVHKRIRYLIGSSVSDKIINEIREHIADIKPHAVLVILDSNHSKDHVSKELKIYNSFITTNSYLVVEDTNINGHPVYASHGPGPMEAVAEFLKTNNTFKIDKTMEKHFITFNPGGYLKKI